MNFAFDTTISLSLIVGLLTALIGWIRLQFKTVNTAIETQSARLDKRIDALADRLDQRVDVQGERLDRHDGRLTTCEQMLANLPNKDEMHSIAMSISDIRGDVRELRANFTGSRELMSRLEVIVSRQEDHLLNRAGK